MTTTKKALARKVAGELEISNTLAHRALQTLFEAMREILIEGDRIEVRGFGTLGTKETAPKPSARNPRTGEIVPVPARRKVYFRMGRRLREGLNQER